MKGIDFPPKNPVSSEESTAEGTAPVPQEALGGGDMERTELEGGASVQVSRTSVEEAAARKSPRSGTRRRGKGGSQEILAASAPEAGPASDSATTETGPVAADATHAELQTRLASVLSPEADRLAEVQERLKGAAKIDDAPKESVAAAERADVQAKEAEYLNAYKALEQKSTFFGKLMNGKKLKDESVHVEALKRSYDEARVAYAAAITKNVDASVADRSENFEARTREKYEKLKASGMLMRLESGEEIGFDAFLRRASAKAEGAQERVSSYLRFREVIRPLTEKKIAARQEALDARGQSAFAKGLTWFGKKNAELEKNVGGKTQARAVRAAASTLLVVAGGALLGSAGATSLLALAGYGSYKFARAFGGSLAAVAVAKFGGKKYEARGRKVQKEAQAELVSAGRNVSGASELTLTDLQKADKKREKLAVAASEETLQKKKLLVETLIAIGVGAGVAGALAELSSMQHAADAAVGSTDLTPEQAKGIEGLMSGSSARHALPENALGAAKAGVPDAIPTAPAAPVFENLLKGTAIHAPGQGMGELFVDLRHALNADAAAIPHPSPALAHVLGENPNTLTREILAASDGKSLAMHTGDQLLVDENQNVWFQAKGGEPHLIFENDPSAPNGFKVHPIENGHLQADAPHHAEVAHADAAPAEHSATDAVPETPTEAPDAGAAEISEYVPVAAELDGINPAGPTVAPSPETVPPVEHQTAPASVPEKPAEMPVHEAQHEAPTASNTAEVFTNHNNVPVDLREPRAYVTSGKGGSEVLSIVGGKGHDSFYAAQQYVTEHPEYFKEHPDAIVRFAATDIDSVTGAARPYTGGFRLAPDGTPSMVVDNELPPPPSAETFTKRLEFTFKRTS